MVSWKCFSFLICTYPAPYLGWWWGLWGQLVVETLRPIGGGGPYFFHFKNFYWPFFISLSLLLKNTFKIVSFAAGGDLLRGGWFAPRSSGGPTPSDFIGLPLNPGLFMPFTYNFTYQRTCRFSKYKMLCLFPYITNMTCIHSQAQYKLVIKILALFLSQQHKVRPVMEITNFHCYSVCCEHFTCDYLVFWFCVINFWNFPFHTLALHIVSFRYIENLCFVLFCFTLKIETFVLYSYVNINALLSGQLLSRVSYTPNHQTLQI